MEGGGGFFVQELAGYFLEGWGGGKRFCARARVHLNSLIAWTVAGSPENSLSSAAWFAAAKTLCITQHPHEGSSCAEKTLSASHLESRNEPEERFVALSLNSVEVLLTKAEVVHLPLRV